MSSRPRPPLPLPFFSTQAELWPLFGQHFSRAEQNAIVGNIIGRTGANVLQTMLPWVTAALSEPEREGMLDSMREATRNTMFGDWLSAWWDADERGREGGEAAAAAPAALAPPGAGAQQRLADVAAYLATASPELLERDTVGLQVREPLEIYPRSSGGRRGGRSLKNGIGPASPSSLSRACASPAPLTTTNSPAGSTCSE